MVIQLLILFQDTNFAPNNKDVAPIPEGMSGAEVGKRLNGLVSADLRFCFALIFRDLIFFSPRSNQLMMPISMVSAVIQHNINAVM